MLTYQSVQRKSKQLKSLTSLDRVGFEQLHKEFSVVVDQYLRHYTLTGKERQRAFKGRRSSIFSSTEDMLLFILIYLKNNPLQEYQAAQFGMSQPQANDWIHLTLGWLRQTLSNLKELPARPHQQLEYVLADQVQLLLDGTERPVQRSGDAETQKQQYSGKKKPTRSKTTYYALLR
jgi:hypothetical protein